MKDAKMFLVGFLERPSKQFFSQICDHKPSLLHAILTLFYPGRQKRFYPGSCNFRLKHKPNTSTYSVHPSFGIVGPRKSLGLQNRPSEGSQLQEWMLPCLLTNR